MFLAVISSKIMLLNNFIIANEKSHKNNEYLIKKCLFDLTISHTYSDLPQSYY